MKWGRARRELQLKMVLMYRQNTFSAVCMMSGMDHVVLYNRGHSKQRSTPQEGLLHKVVSPTPRLHSLPLPTVLHLLRQLKRAEVPQDDMLHFYISIIHPVLEYAVAVWHTGLTADLSDQLEAIQKRALRIIFGGSSFYVRQLC